MILYTLENIQSNDCLKYEKIEKDVCNTENQSYPKGYICSKCSIHNGTKTCPSCKSNIEKNGGCKSHNMPLQF